MSGGSEESGLTPEQEELINQIPQLKEALTKVQSDLAELNTNLVESVNNLNKNMSDGFNTINGGINNEIRPAIEKNSEDITSISSEIESINSSMATTEFVNQKISDLIGGAPEALDTLKEVADAIENGGDTIQALTEVVGKKADQTALDAEISRAKEAEATKATKEELNEEVTARGEADTQLQSDIQSEATTARAAEKELSDKIASLESEVSIKANQADVDAQVNIINGTTQKLQEDLTYVADTVIPQMNENTAKALDQKVTWELGTKIQLPLADGAVSGIINAGTPEAPEAGDGAQLLGLSKWNKVEVGSSKVQLNLNGPKGEDDRPTYNDDFKIALQKDIPEVSNFATKEELNSKADTSVVTKLQSDLTNVAEVIIPEMNTNTAKGLDGKVSWDEEKKVISIPMDGSISALREADPEEGTQPEGGVLLAQRTYDEGATLVTEVGTTKNKLTLNASERPQIDVAGVPSEKVAYVSDVTEVWSKLPEGIVTSVFGQIDYNANNVQVVYSKDIKATGSSVEDSEYTPHDSEYRFTIDAATQENAGIMKASDKKKLDELVVPTKVSELENDSKYSTTEEVSAVKTELVGTDDDNKDLDTIKAAKKYAKELVDTLRLPVDADIPVRTIQDKVYTKEEILGWFHVESDEEMKNVMANRPVFCRMDVTYSALPHIYRMPIQYLAYESETQIKFVILGLDTSNDNPVKYEIVANLDESIIESSSNVKVTKTEFTMA